MNTENKELAIQKSEISIESILQSAIDKNVSIETIEKLFTLREKIKAEQDKEAFLLAMSQFQKDCPVIEKTKPVMNKDGKSIRYKYAPLDSIVNQVKKPLGDNGLSYSFDEKKDATTTTAICTVKHIQGHTETSAFQIPIGVEEYMSDPQKHGARMTFAKRYAFCNAFGILTGDEDTDAEEKKNNEKVDSLKGKIAEISTIEELKKFYEANKGLGKEFDKLVLEQKNFIIKANNE